MWKKFVEWFKTVFATPSSVYDDDWYSCPHCETGYDPNHDE